jgi:hypothetical protein
LRLAGRKSSINLRRSVGSFSCTVDQKTDERGMRAEGGGTKEDGRGRQGKIEDKKIRR